MYTLCIGYLYSIECPTAYMHRIRCTHCASVIRTLWNVVRPTMYGVHCTLYGVQLDWIFANRYLYSLYSNTLILIKINITQINKDGFMLFIYLNYTIYTIQCTYTVYYTLLTYFYFYCTLYIVIQVSSKDINNV